MIAENKKKIDEKLNKIPDEYVANILDYLNALQSKQNTPNTISSMLLSEQSLAKEWLSKEEEDAWAHL